MVLFLPGTATAADVAAGKTFSAGSLYNAVGTNTASAPVRATVYPTYRDTVYNFPPAIIDAINALTLWQVLLVQITNGYMGASDAFIFYQKDGSGIKTYINNTLINYNILTPTSFSRTAGLTNEYTYFKATLIKGDA